VSSGKLRIEPERLDLSQVVKDVEERWRGNVQGVELRVSLPGPVEGTWDRLRIEQVVENLVSNALKYGKGNPVEVVLEATADHARLEVRDHGAGIPEEDRARIFERFERLAAHRHHGGFGLGLWIARQAVEAHGGRIAVESRPGEGSAFVVFLPR
jgi:signal transduction histidine kinase